MILSYPWVFPVLRDWFPRGSPQLMYIWYAMGVASLAVLVYYGSQFFIGAWDGLKNRSANMHTLIALGTGVAWIYSTIAMLFPQLFPSQEFTDVYYDVTVVVTALEMLARETSQAANIPVEFQRRGTEKRLNPNVELALYLMAQEALNNVARHAQASQACLSMSFTPQAVTLQVTDDGKGFEVPKSPAEFAPCP